MNTVESLGHSDLEGMGRAGREKEDSRRAAELLTWMPGWMMTPFTEIRNTRAGGQVKIPDLDMLNLGIVGMSLVEISS